MPIDLDDVLTSDDRLLTNKRQSLNLSNRDEKKCPHRLISDGMAVLGRYLVQEYFDSPRHENFLEYAAPYILKITPNSHSMSYHADTTRRQHISFVSALDAEYLAECLRGIGGEHLINCDLLTNEEFRPDEHAEHIFPEYRAIEENVCNAIQGKGHPYVTVMGMKPENRPLFAMAVFYGITNDEISIPESNAVKNKILMTVPSLHQVSAIAEQYDVHEIKDAISDFNSVIEQYRSSW